MGLSMRMERAEALVQRARRLGGVALMIGIGLVGEFGSLGVGVC